MRMMLVALACALSGCTAAPRAPEPIVRTVTVDREVAVRCVKVAPVAPAFRSEAEILGPGPEEDYDASFRLWEEWEKLTAYKDQLEAVLPPCLAAAP